ncbi:zinc finger, CCHC-type containing protein [Tanacetum coccineum]
MAAAMKHMVAKLDKFEGSKSGEGANQEKNKWENDDYVCRGIILNGMSDSLFDIYQHIGFGKELWDSLEAKYIVEDTSSKKFLDSDKPKGNNVAGPFVVNMVEHNNSIKYNDNKAFLSTSKLNDSILWHARLGHAHYKRMQDISKDGLILDFDIDTEKCKTCMLTKITKKPFQNVKRETKVLELIHSDLCDLHATPSLGNKKYFLTFIDDDSRVPDQKIQDDREVIPEEITEEVVVQQPEPELRKSKRNRTPKNFGPKFQLYLIEGTRDEVYDEHSYCFDVEDDPKTFDEAMKSQDVTFCKEAINDEMDSIMGNNTWVLADLPTGCKPLEAHVLQSSQGCAWNLLKRRMKSLLLNGLFL